MTPPDPQRFSTSVSRRHLAGEVWRARLAAEIWVHFHGWALPVGGLLLIAGGLLFTQVLPLHNEVDQLRSRLQSAQAEPKAALPPAPALPPEAGQQLRSILRQPEGDPAQVKRIAGIARLHGIELPQGQYTSARQAPSGIEHTDVTFNFVGRYPQSRAFIEGVLRELPNVSVDRVSFERDAALGAEAEITLRLTLWRWPTGSRAEVLR